MSLRNASQCGNISFGFNAEKGKQIQIGWLQQMSNMEVLCFMMQGRKKEDLIKKIFLGKDDS